MKLALVGLLLGACKRGTEPGQPSEPSPRLTLTGTTTTHGRLTGGTYFCDYQLTATVTAGRLGEAIFWASETREWRRHGVLISSCT
jgi:hypothetical protein